MENYETYEMLGEGGFGQVFLVKDLRDGNFYAIKAIDIKNSEKGDVYVSDIENEIEIFRRLSEYPKCADHVVCFYDSFRENLQGRDTYFLVFEYLVGRSFATYIEEEAKTLAEEEMWDIINGLITGINYIHSNGVAHRDISKYNVILTDEYNVKFIDFGLSCIYNGCEEAQAAMRFQQQPPEKYMGTQLVNFEYAKAADIWGIGCIIYELIYGENVVPFMVEDAHGNTLPYDVIVNDINKGFPIEYKHDNNVAILLSHLLDVNPITRFTSQQALEFVKMYSK